MKSVAIILAFILPGIFVHAQKISIDKITGDSSWSAGPEKLYARPSLSGTAGELLTVAASKGKAGLSVAVFYRSGELMAFSPDEKIQLKLASGDVVEATPAAPGISSPLQGVDGSSSTTVFLIDKVTAGKLTSSPVTFIRMIDGSETREFEIKEKFQKSVSKVLSLVINK